MCVKATLKWHEPLKKASYAMGNCYGKKCSEKALLNAVTAGHTSLLEHVTATLDIECSQKCLAQVTRHRHFSYTVESTRGMDITNNGYHSFDFPDSVLNIGIQRHWELSLGLYNKLLEHGVSKEQAAYVLPMMANVRFTMSGNLRAWIEYLKQRLCHRASIEHKQLAMLIFQELNKVYPNLVNSRTIGVCVGCTEKSCDFATHEAKQKTPIVGDIKKLEVNND